MVSQEDYDQALHLATVYKNELRICAIALTRELDCRDILEEKNRQLCKALLQLEEEYLQHKKYVGYWPALHPCCFSRRKNVHLQRCYVGIALKGKVE